MIVKRFEGSDYEGVLKLWNNSLGDIWPIKKEQIESRINSGYNLVVEIREAMIGFINCQHNDKKGQVTLLMIDKNYQRQGLGTRLLTEAIKQLKDWGVEEFSIGSGVGTYFWPGVPANLPVAINFFKKHGVVFDETNLDMVTNLKDFKVPDEVMKRVSGLNLSFEVIKKEGKREVVNFEKVNFPNWTKYFQTVNFTNEFVAKLDGEIVGSVILFGKDEFVWSELFNNAGGIGALGVAEKHRNKGIGLALAAKAIEELKARGVEDCYLGWTCLEDWYAKLGFKVWRKYEYGKLV